MNRPIRGSTAWKHFLTGNMGSFNCLPTDPTQKHARILEIYNNLSMLRKTIDDQPLKLQVMLMLTLTRATLDLDCKDSDALIFHNEATQKYRLLIAEHQQRLAVTFNKNESSMQQHFPDQMRQQQQTVTVDAKTEIATRSANNALLADVKAMPATNNVRYTLFTPPRAAQLKITLGTITMDFTEAPSLYSSHFLIATYLKWHGAEDMKMHFSEEIDQDNQAILKILLPDDSNLDLLSKTFLKDEAFGAIDCISPRDQHFTLMTFNRDAFCAGLEQILDVIDFSLDEKAESTPTRKIS